MREDTQIALEFKGISGKRVTVDFSGGDVTSDAGALVLTRGKTTVYSPFCI